MGYNFTKAEMGKFVRNILLPYLKGRNDIEAYREVRSSEATKGNLNSVKSLSLGTKVEILNVVDDMSGHIHFQGGYQDLAEAFTLAFDPGYSNGEI